MSPLDKALALARLGIKVFPCNAEDRSPLTFHGFYDASIDFELIATWFSLDFPDAEVGVWAGGSGLIAADIDRKNGKDGFATLAERNLSLTPTEHYTTATGGGEHHIWQSEDPSLTLVGGVFGPDSGIDIRAGGSYFIWWGEEVPESREAFSTDVPQWIIDAATPAEDEFTGEGFSGSVNEWLDAISDEVLPSSAVRFFLDRIPSRDFGHPEMVDLAWAVVRMGSERETGVKGALEALKSAWLREPYNTAKNRRDFDVALRGAINKAGRIQNPVPTVTLKLREAMARAEEAGIANDIKTVEARVSGNSTEADLARARKEMFQVAARGGLSASTALSIVTNSKSFKASRVGLESAWFGDGEPEFHEAKIVAEEIDAEEAAAREQAEREIESAKTVARLSADASSFTFLDEDEQALMATPAYRWWGDEYLEWVSSRLKYFNRPYHVASMWAALSSIVSPWGKIPLAGAKPLDCNLYITVLGDSTTGKSESWLFGTTLIDEYWGLDHPGIIGDVSKLSALALHRALILRDGESSLIFGDEVQSFFQGVQNSQWQTGILGDVSSHYGGDVTPKLTLNDKEISGKRAKTLLTAYFTGIADQTFDAISLSHWTNGFFYRFLFGFGNPRIGGDYKIMMGGSAASYTTQIKAWADEFKRLKAFQDMKPGWGEGRLVDWEPDALERMERLNEQMDTTMRPSPQYDTVFVGANGRFLNSIMKVATIVALLEVSEMVTLRHVLIAISYAGPWHRSMVLAVGETGKEPFEREVEKALIWIKRNAFQQVGKKPVIQRSAVMRAFRPNEIADRLLRQLTEEGWLVKSADMYEVQD